jgi:hypothetical protein
MAILLPARTVLAALSALAALGAAPAWSACVTTGAGAGGGARMADASGAIGVVDVLTASSSVCVNGLEIHYDDGTAITINGRRAHAGQLALGQVVAVETRASAGRLAARNIAVLKVLEGPVTRADPDTRTVFVMDQPVRVTDETMMPEQVQLAALGPGATVEVSGYRNAHGQVVASRIDMAPPRSAHSAIGRMKQRDARTGEMGGLLVALPAGMHVQKQSDVLVRGLWDGGQLRAGTIAGDPSMEMLARVERVVVESLVHEARRGDRLRIGAHQIRIGRQTRIEPAARSLRIDQRVRVTGLPDNRRGIAAERIVAAPSASARGMADQRRRPGDDRERAEKELDRSAQPVRRPDRFERPEPVLAERVERVESPRAERVRTERPEPTRVERPEPTRIERITERLERPERSERSERGERD